ncbi:MAG TPA: RagB/SusD family nutrient uptake outer membrane protein [Dinghuibacter sp.]|uniref:RagB/SusD family nutrient uptake outer membrane protein n=1 Tax=Dinghuibacter sp. TaxID=2024697 RepID=UPI002BA2E16C|nr:RagB/SusD family nutrient uptake outer membrane protein [Dinghuibacter sp.]HTJ13397.1 RagB/SusD family nutrient uptake outer membrane protein [Dinghuibacter sp.]
MRRCITYLILAALVSCKKFVQVDAPAGGTANAQVFSSDASATAAMNGVYSLMMGSNNAFTAGAVTIYGGLSADELFNTTPSPLLDQFHQNTLISSNSLLVTNCWGDAYSYIYQVNAILDGLPKSAALSAEVREQLTGEAECVRAFCYLYLADLFGRVPLETGTDYTINATMPQTPRAQVYAQIVTDLLNAQNLLTPAYPTAGPLKPNRWTAAALLARVYCYERDWADAVTESSKVIDSGGYHLAPNPNDAFLAYSPEAIWQLAPVVPGFNTFEGYDFIPADAGTAPAFAVDTTLVDAFEPGDLRLGAWLGKRTVGGQTYYYPYKYKIQSGSAHTENYTMLRLSEQYLIRAEARAALGDAMGAVADLDTVRVRAGLGPVATASPAAILQERRVELCFEWGHRWFDLTRNQAFSMGFFQLKPAFTLNDTLYPIPLSQLQANPSLTQNQGY